jgi:hypothetical protein
MLCSVNLILVAFAAVVRGHSSKVVQYGEQLANDKRSNVFMLLET